MTDEYIERLRPALSENIDLHESEFGEFAQQTDGETRGGHYANLYVSDGWLRSETVAELREHGWQIDHVYRCDDGTDAIVVRVEEIPRGGR